MKCIFLSLLVQVASAISLLSLGTEFNSHTTFDEWEEFKHTHGKTYDSQEDENLRFFIYRANKRLVDDHNDGFQRGEHSFSLEVNQFADLLASEFADLRHGFSGGRPGLEESEMAATFLRLPDGVSLPEEVDWRTKGAVTDVQDQGDCGSCWAFSATGALEGQHFRKTGQLIKLSEQNLIDCATPFGAEGCEGGRMRAAFRYAHEQGGVDTEAGYPYQGHDQDRCRFSENDIGATDVGYMGIPEGDEDALKEALAVHGPVSIAIDASKPSFQFYSSGIYDDGACSDSHPNHAMLAVGYGTDELGKDFWLVKNSWSVGWGENGYARIARSRNTCGIASSGVFPLV